TSSADCEGATNDPGGQTDASGTLDWDYTVFTLPNALFNGSSITCDATHLCSLFVGLDYNDFTAAKTLVPIDLAPAATTKTTTIRADVPETNRPILLPLSALGLFGVALVVAGRRRSAASKA